MNVELMLELAKQAKKNREEISDVSLSFCDIDSRLVFDRAAERLLMVLIIKRCRAAARLNLN